MSVEKYIHGKHDDAHHDGRASNIRREQEADFHLTDFWKDVWPEIVEAAEEGTLEPEEEFHPDKPKSP